MEREPGVRDTYSPLRRKTKSSEALIFFGIFRFRRIYPGNNSTNTSVRSVNAAVETYSALRSTHLPPTRL